MTALDDVEVDARIAFVEDDLAILEGPLESLVDLDLGRFAAAQNRSPRVPEKFDPRRRLGGSPRSGFFVLKPRDLETPG